MSGIPVLVLGNKNDLPEALNAEQLIDRLGLASITTKKFRVIPFQRRIKIIWILRFNG